MYVYVLYIDTPPEWKHNHHNTRLYNIISFALKIISMTTTRLILRFCVFNQIDNNRYLWYTIYNPASYSVLQSENSMHGV